jgi:hypothetical protein
MKPEGRMVARRKLLGFSLVTFAFRIFTLSGNTKVFGQEQQPKDRTIRGTLRLKQSAVPLLLTTDSEIPITGDESTMGVFCDKRVQGLQFELTGRFRASGQFETNPIHTQAMVVLRGQQRLFVTYWCDICAIRTYTPGICWCCQEDTELDLRERYDS